MREKVLVADVDEKYLSSLNLSVLQPTRYHLK